MKAVLIIDVDEIENCDAAVYVYKNNIAYQGFYKVELKPIPHKYTQYLGGDYSFGWNDCIDKILGVLDNE